MEVTQTNLQTPSPPSTPSKSRLRKVGLFLAFVIILGALSFAVYFLGSRNPHTFKRHNLYSSFDDSPAHKKLATGLGKGRLSILYGKKQDAVFKFAQHLANQWTQKGKSVIIEGFDTNQIFPIQVSKTIVQQINSRIGADINNTDWILISRNGELISEEKISQIVQNYPNSKIVIITTNKKQKIKDFKSFQYTKLQSKQLLKSITKSYKVKQAVADILSQYYDTHEDLFSGLNPQKFDHKEHLGENFKPIEKLSKQEESILKQLCQKGAKKDKKIKQLQSLASYGVIFLEGKHIWENQDTLLNYELNTGSNCINKFATQAEVKAYKQRKLKEEQQKKAKEQEQRRKQQLKKAQEAKRLQQEQKKQEELLKKKEQSQKAKQSAQPKKQKSQPSKKKQAKEVKKK